MDPVCRSTVRSLPYSDAGVFDYPQLSIERFTGQCPEETCGDCQCVITCLTFESEYHNARIVMRWILADVREIRIEGDDRSRFASAGGGDCFVLGTTKALFQDSSNLVPRLTKELAQFRRKILVQLEPHGLGR